MTVIRPGVHCDPCLAPLIRALYENGFPTVASCCGHGKQPANVALADGREVFVADPEWAETIWAAIAAKRQEMAVDDQPAWVEHAVVGPGGVEVDPGWAGMEGAVDGTPRGIPPLRPRPVG